MTLRRDFIKIPFASLAVATLSMAAGPSFGQTPVTLLNVSYDPTRELYLQFNQAFARYWKGKTGQDVVVKQSHGGSGKQARSVIDGLDADVVTLGLAGDIDALANNGAWVAKDWQKRLPHNASPYTSTMVLVVRRGNPKGIKDWDDLVRPGVGVITSNPKTSGGGRWAYLAAWGYAKRKWRDDAKARDFVSKLYANVPVLDTGARGATNTFAQRGIGDVLLAWENEALLSQRELGKDGFQIVLPSVSILAEPPVALVDKNVDQHGTREVAQAYLKFLYSPQGQELEAKHFYRPRSAEVAQKYAAQFPKVNTFTIDELGGWRQAQAKFFADGAIFDQIGPGN
jgi:sulfate/thiosulfate transport system substrate-binding protein